MSLGEVILSTCVINQQLRLSTALGFTRQAAAALTDSYSRALRFNWCSELNPVPQTGSDKKSRVVVVGGIIGIELLGHHKGRVMNST